MSNSKCNDGGYRLDFGGLQNLVYILKSCGGERRMEEVYEEPVEIKEGGEEVMEESVNNEAFEEEQEVGSMASQQINDVIIQPSSIERLVVATWNARGMNDSAVSRNKMETGNNLPP
jgi:hypothetical protein